MTMNALPPEIRWQRLDLWARLSGSARRRMETVPGSVGSFFWSGVWGTYFWVDPAEHWSPCTDPGCARQGWPINRTFRHLTYGAFLVPTRACPASAPAAIDQRHSPPFEGTYRFAIAPVTRQARRREFGGLGIEVAMQDGLLKVPVSDPRRTCRQGLASWPNDIITHFDRRGDPRHVPHTKRLRRCAGPSILVRLKIAARAARLIELTIFRP